jgi:hypothetical protein
MRVAGLLNMCAKLIGAARVKVSLDAETTRLGLNADRRFWSNKQTSTRQHGIGITYHAYLPAVIAPLCIKRYIYCDVDRRHAAMDDVTMQPPPKTAFIQTREAAQRA